jgi:predicted TIM-barrel fold metal-dependent hydrolase
MASSAADLSARTIEPVFIEKAKDIPTLLVSADSHVDEDPKLWEALPADIREQLPAIRVFTAANRPQGGLDPKLRIEHMDLDGVAAEILYPTSVLQVFSAPHKAQEAAFRLYNDWLADYCKTAPKRLYGVPCLCVYDIDEAIREMQRCNDMGLLGGLIWQVPDPKLPFNSDHYERLWAAAAEIGLPINLHILSGHSYDRSKLKGIESVRGAVNIKTADTINTVFDLVWTGSTHEEFPISRLPSELFRDHVYATFMDDTVGSQMLAFWGQDNCLWSSDYPHANMTWPHSRAFLAKQIGHLDYDLQARLMAGNVMDLYGLKI